MTFLDLNAIGMLAREHQQRLIEEAAEQRLLRNARDAHPSRWNRRRHNSPQPPDAA
jgi:hypothetical protein